MEKSGERKRSDRLVVGQDGAPKPVQLEFLPHPKAPLFKNPQSAKLFLNQLMSEISSPNMQLTEEFRELVRQASLVNLWFWLKYVIGYAQQFDRLTAHLHVDMCNFRQRIAVPGSRGLMILPRGFGKTKICTEGGMGWALLRNPDEAIRVSNAIVETARDFVGTTKSFYDSNEFMEWAFPEYYVKHPRAQERWNDSEFVLPNRTKHRREASVEFGGVTASAEGHHHSIHIVDDPIGLAALNANRGANAVMESTKHWFWASENTLLDSGIRGSVVVIGTRYSVDDLFSSIIEEANEFYGYPMKDVETNPEGEWKVYYRKAIEDGLTIYPEEMPIDRLRRMAEKDWWTYITQYQNEPASSGMSELYDYGFKPFTMEWEEENNRWFILTDDWEDEIYLGDCDVVIVGDPAATERYVNARTSKTAIGVLATHWSGKRFLIWLRADYVQPNQMMDWLFEANQVYSKYRRGTFLEANGPFKVFVDPKTGTGVLREEERKRGASLCLRGFAATGDKDARIRSYLQPELNSGNLYVLESYLPMVEEERKAFPMSTQKDILDMLAAAVMLSSRPMAKKELQERQVAEDEWENRHHNAAGY